MPKPKLAAGAGVALMALLQLAALASSSGLLEQAPFSLSPDQASRLAATAIVLTMAIGLWLFVQFPRRTPPPAPELGDEPPPPPSHAADEPAVDAAEDMHEIQSQFLSMVAHEVRTPLSVITASTGTLRLLVPDNQPAIGERIERIDRAVRRMKRLLQLCLDAERIERERDAPQRWPAAAGSLIADVVRGLEDDIARRIVLQDETIGLEILVDRRMLGIVFSNLIDNAVKYTPPDTPITVQLAPQAPGGVGGLQIDVIDQGPGIPDAVREKIFEKHFRRQELNDVPGLGLGLYLARRILFQHGGSITAVAGKGGHFRIIIPTQIPPN